MSTMTLTAPLARPRSRPVGIHSGGRPTRPSMAVPVRGRPAPTRSAGASPARPLRLTARGRVALLACLGAVALAVPGVSGALGLGAPSGVAPPVRFVTVQPGQSLWAIAGEVAPGADRRDTVAQIRDLNALPGSGVQAGQQIAVPGW